MHAYGVREVERLLGLPRSTVRALITAGFVSPARGPRNAWRFSFQDLVVMRTAQALVAANVPTRRITSAMKKLRRQAESGQYLLEFGAPAEGALKVIERRPQVAPQPDWFAAALAIERDDPKGALELYARAIAADPQHLDARVNRALLLHEARRLEEAERACREAILACGTDSVLLFNYGVLLEDMGKKPEALQAYRAAVSVDPRMADGHYNVALLYEKLGKPREALRHMSQYRRLVATRRK